LGFIRQTWKALQASASIEDCLYQAKWGMEEHLDLLKEQGLPVPKENLHPRIVIQNQESLPRAS